MIISLDTTPRHLPRCQSTNHRRCYGDLWQCEQCGKTVCCAEGTTDQPELCDDCWVAVQDEKEPAL